MSTHKQMQYNDGLCTIKINNWNFIYNFHIQTIQRLITNVSPMAFIRPSFLENWIQPYSVMGISNFNEWTLNNSNNDTLDHFSLALFLLIKYIPFDFAINLSLSFFFFALNSNMTSSVFMIENGFIYIYIWCRGFLFIIFIFFFNQLWMSQLIFA